MLPDLLSDPFGERSSPLETRRIQVLGAQFHFTSNSRELMDLVDVAYARLPRHRLPRVSRELRVNLILTPRTDHRSRSEPPPVAMISGSGLLGGATYSSNLIVVAPRERAALVAVSPAMLRFPYHTRYELIEFAVFTLAARVQRLIPLHAACIGEGGRGILLIGPSGSGKSTVALHCLLDGFDILSEDSAFIAPETMLATGVSNFLHIRADSLRWLGHSGTVAAIRHSPVIRRRSGAKKFEVDLRRGGFRLAKSPQKIVAVVFLSPQQAGRKPLLTPLSKRALLANLADTQAYAASHPQWRLIGRNAARLEAFELQRGRHPTQAVEALRSVLTAP